MTTELRNFGKKAVLALGAGAMVFAPISPAFARHDREKRANAGEIISGVLILGGIAAIASAAAKDDRRRGGGYNDYDRRDNGYDRASHHANPRASIERCVAAVERDAHRMGYGYMRVTQIRDMVREGRGWYISGDMVVQPRRGYGGEYRDGGYGREGRHGHGHSRPEYGGFSCQTERGHVVGVRYHGLRNNY